MKPNIRAAVEALRPIAGDHPCASPIYRAMDAGADHATLIDLAQHLVTCEGHDRYGGMQVVLDLLATILDYGHAAPHAHPARAFAILGHAHGRAYAEAIALMWSSPPVAIEQLLEERGFRQIDATELIR